MEWVVMVLGTMGMVIDMEIMIVVHHQEIMVQSMIVWVTDGQCMMIVEVIWRTVEAMHHQTVMSDGHMMIVHHMKMIEVDMMIDAYLQEVVPLVQIAMMIVGPCWVNEGHYLIKELLELPWEDMIEVPLLVTCSADEVILDQNLVEVMESEM